uniref:ERCC4 domain-containing protein n=1 Tax=Glossina palpalis gambiensis TaxID=67801 RepID=A0A1B0BHK4_9MUSC
MTSNDKLLKKAIRDQQKRLKPGECLKYVRLVLDIHLISTSFGQSLLRTLRESLDLKYELRNLPVKQCIVWERSAGQLILDPEEVKGLSEEWQLEEHIARILTHGELKHLIKMDLLEKYSNELKCNYPGKQHIILYLKPTEKPSHRETQALLELQILHQLKVYEVPKDMTELVKELQRLSKAIAEAPYKKQKNEPLSGFKKFLANDKKQCVQIEGCNGFRRLFQQHLNRLPLVTLEVAETIIEKYSCPKTLMDDLANNPDAVKELADLKIKRSGLQALQTDRRIGQVLASKLQLLYTTHNPDTLI